MGKNVDNDSKQKIDLNTGTSYITLAQPFNLIDLHKNCNNNVQYWQHIEVEMSGFKYQLMWWNGYLIECI